MEEEQNNWQEESPVCKQSLPSITPPKRPDGFVPPVIAPHRSSLSYMGVLGKIIALQLEAKEDFTSIHGNPDILPIRHFF